VKPHRRYSEKEKRTLLSTVERYWKQSGQSMNWILSELGLTRSVYYDWLERGREGTLTDRVVIPRSPRAALSEEIEAVVSSKLCQGPTERGIPPACMDDD